MNINNLRKKIDEIDIQILKLLEKRVLVAREIGLYKKQNGLPVYDPEREKVLLETKKKLTELPGENIDAIFKEIMKLSRIIQEKL